MGNEEAQHWLFLSFPCLWCGPDAAFHPAASRSQHLRMTARRLRGPERQPATRTPSPGSAGGPGQPGGVRAGGRLRSRHVRHVSAGRLWQRHRGCPPPPSPCFERATCTEPRLCSRCLDEGVLCGNACMHKVSTLKTQSPSLDCKVGLRMVDSSEPSTVGTRLLNFLVGVRILGGGHVSLAPIQCTLCSLRTVP